MDPERYQRIREIFAGASVRHGPERAAWLDAECGVDRDMRREVERLLGARTVPTGRVMPDLDGSMERCGPYEVRRELGRGGMGRVFEAIDTRGGARVALKLLHPHLVGAARGMERFEREARLGMAITHPGVVRALAVGEEDGRHYIAMEYVEGRTLRALLADYGTLPETLLREIARQTADGLAAIHDAGIVHRDLKPDNVLITDDQRIRIMDLGVARLMEATVQLTRDGQFLGSLHYAAPEQLDGRPVGPTADLYALGVLLYELATGGNPFAYDVPGESIRAHLDRVPPPATEVAPDVSPFLSEVLATLLAKDPAVRFPDAATLCDVLARGEAAGWWSERAYRRLTIRVPRLAVRRESALHGRAEPLAQLDRAWREACSGDGRAVWIEGEDGIGKSRLLDAFLAALAPDHVHVLYGSFPPSGGMQGIHDAVLDKFGTGRLADALAPHLDRSRPLVESFAALLRREPGDLALGDDAVQALCCDLLRSLARERPTVWIVDDLHLAPEEARRVAAALARTAAGTRALVVVTARADLPAGETAAFSRLEHTTRIALPRLDHDDVASILREVCADPHLAERLAPELARRSDGIPWFVLELLKGLEEQGALRRDAAGLLERIRPLDEFHMPSGVRDAMAARVGRLATADREVLDAAAVQGFAFDADVLARVLERPVVAVLRTLAELERRDGVVRAEGRRHHFDHHLLREFMYGELPAPLRAAYHARIADAHAAAAGPEGITGGVARDVVRHHLRGEQPARATPHLRAALDYLARRHLRGQELELLTRALEIRDLLAGKDRAEMALRRARVLDFLQRRDEQGRAVDEALAVARALEDPALEARGMTLRGAWHWGCGRLREAAECFGESMRLARAAGARGQEASARFSRGTMLWRLGRIDEAEADHREAVRLATEAGDRRTRGSAMNHLALVLVERGEVDEARRLFEDHRTICREIGDRQLEGTAWGNLGVVDWQCGEWESARAHVERCHGIAVEVGDRRLESTAIGNLGLIALELGRLDEAQRRFEAQLSLAHETGNPTNTIHALLDLGLVDLRLGRPARARPRLERVITMAAELGVRLYDAIARLRLACVEEEAGRRGEACRFTGEAIEVLEGLKDAVNTGAALTQLARLGDPDDAPARLARAEKLAEQGRDAGGRVLACAMAASVSCDAADVERARALLEEVGARAGVFARMEAHWRLFRASDREEHRTAARTLLEEVRAHAPADTRTDLAERMTLYRAIAGSP